MEEEFWTVYEHRIDKYRIAYPGVRVPKHIRAMSRRRRRILQAVQTCKFTTFLTFTYDDQLIPKAYEDLSSFHNSSQVREALNRIKMYFRKHRMELFSYVWVCEYGEEKGRPHWHVLTTIPYEMSILHQKLRGWWGYGFVKITRLNNAYHAGKYVDKYMVKNDVQATLRKYGTSRDILGTPRSSWERKGVFHREELELVVQDYNYWLARGPMDRYIEVGI